MNRSTCFAMLVGIVSGVAYFANPWHDRDSLNQRSSDWRENSVTNETQSDRYIARGILEFDIERLGGEEPISIMPEIACVKHSVATSSKGKRYLQLEVACSEIESYVVNILVASKSHSFVGTWKIDKHDPFFVAPVETIRSPIAPPPLPSIE